MSSIYQVLQLTTKLHRPHHQPTLSNSLNLHIVTIGSLPQTINKIHNNLRKKNSSSKVGESTPNHDQCGSKRRHTWTLNSSMQEPQNTPNEHKLKKEKRKKPKSSWSKCNCIFIINHTYLVLNKRKSDNKQHLVDPLWKDHPTHH